MGVVGVVMMNMSVLVPQKIIYFLTLSLFFFFFFQLHEFLGVAVMSS